LVREFLELLIVTQSHEVDLLDGLQVAAEGVGEEVFLALHLHQLLQLEILLLGGVFLSEVAVLADQVVPDYQELELVGRHLLAFRLLLVPSLLQALGHLGEHREGAQERVAFKLFRHVSVEFSQLAHDLVDVLLLEFGPVHQDEVLNELEEVDFEAVAHFVGLQHLVDLGGVLLGILFELLEHVFERILPCNIFKQGFEHRNHA